MLIEISGTKKTALANYKKGFWNIWDNERIRSAFNFGNGTMQDLIEYAKRNKAYCCIYDTETKSFIA